MNQQLIKSLLVEIDASTEKLRRALREGGVELEKFEGKARSSGRTAGSGADVVASKQANAMRAIAMTSETMARQGKISGETAKQVINNVSSMAFAFGKNGAIVGAIGISTLAIIQMFTRIREEAARTARETREEFARMEQLDLAGAADRVRALDTGDYRLRQRLGSADPAERAEAAAEARDDFARLGMQGIAQYRAQVAQQLVPLQQMFEEAQAQDRAAVTSFLASQTGEMYTRMKEDLAAMDRLAPEVEKRRNRARNVYDDRIAQQAFKAENELARAREEADEKAGKKASDAAQREKEEADKRLADIDKRFNEAITAWNARLEQALTEGFTGASDEIRRSFMELEQFARESGRDADIPLLRNARDQALELNDLLREAASAMSSGEFAQLWDSIASTEEQGLTGTHAGTIASLRAVRDEALAIANDESRSEKDREKALEMAKKAHAQILALLKEQDDEVKKVTRSLSDQARELGQVIDGVLQMAGAWGGVKREVVDTLRAVAQMGTSAPGILEALGNLRKARDGGGSFKDAAGNVITTAAAGLSVGKAALPFIGALATIGTTLFGDNPAVRERKRIQRENTEAIRRLTDRMGLLGLDVSGTGVGAASSDAGRIARESRRRLGRMDVSGLDLEGLASDLGIDWAELSRVAKEFGITLEGGGIPALEAFVQQLEQSGDKITEFGDSYGERRTLQDARIAAKGITDPIEKLLMRTQPARDLSPAIEQLMAGIDLSTEEGREAVRKEIERLIELMEAGGDRLSREQMGGLKGQEFLDQLLEILGGLEEIGGAVARPGSSLGGISGFRGLTEAAGERMADYLRAIVGSSRTAELQRQQIHDTLKAQLLYLSALAGTPLTVPAGFVPGAQGGARAGGVTMIVNFDAGSIVVHAPAGADAREVGLFAGQAFRDAVSDVLFQDVLRAKRAAGDVWATPRIR
ncbi:MAG: hypothetical protein KF709_02610 [Gemmatimonadaceae bacterium]|nr:hypothetical protein [Gemmatimonadaceae bacterium]